MTEMVEVVVKAPPDRIADLYALVAKLNRPKQGAGASVGTSARVDEAPGTPVA